MVTKPNKVYEKKKKKKKTTVKEIKYFLVKMLVSNV